jgi:hypothetical protein
MPVFGLAVSLRTEEIGGFGYEQFWFEGLVGSLRLRRWMGLGSDSKGHIDNKALSLAK